MTVESNSGETGNPVRRGPKPRDRAETSGPVREPQGRAERVPLGVRKQKLLAETRPGYVGRWINDQDNRVQQALLGGYDFVVKDAKASSDDVGNRISRIVGTKASGHPLTAYLMEIPKPLWDQDQAAKKAGIAATEQLIARGELVQKPGVDGAYVKGISIKRA